MRILLITGEFPPDISGVGDYTLRLAESLRKLNHECIVAARARPITSGLEESAFKVIRSVSRWDFSIYEKMTRLIMAAQPDICHILYHTGSFNWHPAINFLPLALKLKKIKSPIVTTYHEFAAPFFKLSVIPMIIGSDINVVTNDRDNARFSRAPFSAVKQKVVYIPLGPNILQCPLSVAQKAEMRKNLGVDEKEIVVIRFGFLNAFAVEQLKPILSAVNKIIKEKSHPLKVIILGKDQPEARASLVKFAEETRLHGIVKIVGEEDSETISRYLQIADLGIAPYPDGISERRGAFLALIAHGLPVITTRKGQFPANLSEGENVLCVRENQSVSEWKGRLLELIQNAPLRARVAKGAVALSSKYDWSLIAQKYDETYHGIIRKKVAL